MPAVQVVFFLVESDAAVGKDHHAEDGGVVRQVGKIQFKPKEPLSKRVDVKLLRLCQ
jgi:hypothetical protein